MNDFNLPLESLAASANAYAAAHGVQVEKKDNGKSYFECAPISLLPNAYPRSAFEQAQVLAPHFNTLVDRISRDGDFLQNTLGGDVSQADPYTAKLLQLYRQIYLQDKNEYALQADSMGIQRSDYMLNKGRIQQVELNTIASSFAGLSTQVAALHSFLLQRYDGSLQDFLSTAKKAVLENPQATTSNDQDNVPVNPALDRLSLAMSVAVKRYQERFQLSNTKKLAVVFVVQPGESNTVDQRMLEFRLYQNHQIPVLRKSLAELQANMDIGSSSEGALTVDGYEIALVYYRAGYAPTDYPDGLDGVEWQARARLETTRATKCPSLGYHLAGTKKVQQTLARPGVLERFFPSDPDAVQAMRQAFAGLYSLGEDAVEEDLDAVRKVLQDGQQGQFVLKPQREGGGYNYYGDQLADKLRKLVTTATDGTNQLTLDPQLGEFILMERLFPPQQKAILLRAGKIEGSGDSISELGCFGTVVASSAGEVVHNEYAGFLLRTKFAHVDEGGVASGFATLSSPYLC